MRDAMTAVKISAPYLFVLWRTRRSSSIHSHPNRSPPNSQLQLSVLAYPSNPWCRPLNTLHLAYQSKDTTAAFFFSSTTGLPKATQISHRKFHRVPHPRLQPPPAPLTHLRRALYSDVPHRHRASHVLYATVRQPHRTRHTAVRRRELLRSTC